MGKSYRSKPFRPRTGPIEYTGFGYHSSDRYERRVKHPSKQEEELPSIEESGCLYFDQQEVYLCVIPETEDYCVNMPVLLKLKNKLIEGEIEDILSGNAEDVASYFSESFDLSSSLDGETYMTAMIIREVEG